MSPSRSAPGCEPESEAPSHSVGRTSALKMPSRAGEWGSWLSCVGLCMLVIAVAHWRLDAWGGLPAAGIALAMSASVAAGPMLWRRGGLGQHSPVASTLMTILFRTMVMFGGLLFVAATKWPHRNSFAWTLLGCYFVFLVLESVLSIRWYSSRTRVGHP